MSWSLWRTLPRWHLARRTLHGRSLTRWSRSSLPHRILSWRSLIRGRWSCTRWHSWLVSTLRRHVLWHIVRSHGWRLLSRWLLSRLWTLTWCWRLLRLWSWNSDRLSILNIIDSLSTLSSRSWFLRNWRRSFIRSLLYSRRDLWPFLWLNKSINNPLHKVD